MKNLEEARAYQKQEKSNDTSELWSAILATHEALVALGGPGLPELHVNRAKANLIRAGEVVSGDFTDDDLKQIAAADFQKRAFCSGRIGRDSCPAPHRSGMGSRKGKRSRSGWDRKMRK